jgi:hypothetical protein
MVFWEYPVFFRSVFVEEEFFLFIDYSSIYCLLSINIGYTVLKVML